MYTCTWKRRRESKINEVEVKKKTKIRTKSSQSPSPPPHLLPRPRHPHQPPSPGPSPQHADFPSSHNSPSQTPSAITSHCISPLGQPLSPVPAPPPPLLLPSPPLIVFECPLWVCCRCWRLRLRRAGYARCVRAKGERAL